MSTRYKNEAEIILRHTKNWLMTSNETINSFAVDMLAPKVESEAPDTAVEYENWRTNLIRRVQRYFSGSVQLPLAWKWQWLDCLPKKYQDAALKEIWALHGFLDTLPPITGVSSCDASLDQVLASVSEMVGCAAPAHDGVYDQHDNQEQANAMIDSLLSLAARCIDESRKIHAGTGAIGSRHNIAAFSTDGDE
ncbi:hypothetical protein J0J26_20595 [Vibrio vulnificus]|uniref:hypothetical protein n=1 Tax=Vibrio vulnificus TaxID=672 RepID=UPI0019D4B45A|nr:hypothetical protein [Vibrio vulnificus]MBN8090482.1 hypothetical protein [Vibrio vulnificus]MBN8119333.1 hypothetical protein [Vibrio vulnificus]